MDKDKILDYVMNSPANTNPNVLGSMLEGMSGGDNEPFVVTFSQPEFGGAAMADKTYAEISEAFLQHKAVYGLLDRANSMLVYSLQGELNPAGITFRHIGPYVNNGVVTSFTLIIVSIASDDSIIVKDYTYPSSIN